MKQKLYKVLLVLIDIIIINISFLAAYWMRFDGNITDYYFNAYREIVIYINVVKIAIFYFGGMYKSLWRYASIREAFKIVLITAFGNMASIAVLYFIKDPFFSMSSLTVPRSVYIISWILDTAFIGGIRISIRLFNDTRIKNRIKIEDKKRCLIIGAGSAGAMVVKELRAHNDLMRIPIAIIDDDVTKHGYKIDNIPVVGDRLDIQSVVIRKKIDEIIIAIPSVEHSDRKEIIEICKKTGVELKILPGVFELIEGKVSVTQFRPVDISDLLGRDAVKLDIDNISNYLKHSVVLVTGGGGSIGSELCRQIASYDPKQLLILDVYENNAYDIQNELRAKYPSLDLVAIIVSITDEDGINKIFETYTPDIVFHAAAHKHVPLMEDNPVEAIKNNVFGTHNVIKAADKYNTKRFVQISTDKAVNPTNVMGATKRLCEMMIQTYKNTSKTNFAAVRFGNVLNSNGSVIPVFKKQISKGGPVTVTHPDIIRYFMTIQEAVQLVIQAGSMAEGGEIFVLDMGEPVRIDKLARDLIELSGFKPDIDIEVKYTGLRPGEKMFEELLMSEEGLKDTSHEKIFITKPMDITMDELEQKLEILREGVAYPGDNIIEAIENVVSTYKRDVLKHG